MTGRIDSDGRALVDVRVRLGTSSHTIEAWVDTAFTGDLLVPRDLVESSGAEPEKQVQTVLADGTVGEMPIFAGAVRWFDDEERPAEIIPADCRTALLGVGLLLGLCVELDYSAMTVRVFPSDVAT